MYLPLTYRFALSSGYAVTRVLERFQNTSPFRTNTMEQKKITFYNFGPFLCEHGVTEMMGEKITN